MSIKSNIGLFTPAISPNTFQQIQESISTCSWSVSFRLNKSTLELSFFLSSTSQSKLLPLMFASASHSFNENHNSYIFSSCLCWPNKENQSRNNDKLCVVERNWLNCSGFCGLSVLSHKQLVIAINIYFMYVLLEPASQPANKPTNPGSQRSPTIAENNKVFNKNIFRNIYFASILYVFIILPRVENLWWSHTRYQWFNVYKQYVHGVSFLLLKNLIIFPLQASCWPFPSVIYSFSAKISRASCRYFLMHS